MKEYGLKSQKSGLEAAGIKKVKEAFWNLAPAELIEDAVHEEAVKAFQEGEREMA